MSRTLVAGDIVPAGAAFWATFSVGGQAPISSVVGLFGGREAASPDTKTKVIGKGQRVGVTFAIGFAGLETIL
jgi:hypothetical protein